MQMLLRVLFLTAAVIAIYEYVLHPRKPRLPPPERAVVAEKTVPVPAPHFGAHHPKDFNEAKSILRKVYAQGVEIYCGCAYDLDRKDRIDAASCGYKGHGNRSQRIEWEHVVPASVFGQRFAAWKQGDPACDHNGHQEKGRNCARKASEDFAHMEADLYNLLPSLGELNGARSNYPYGEVAGEPRAFGRCDFEIGHKVAEPRTEIRGDLARIYFYMDARYPGFDIVNKQNEGMLAAWDRDDPMDAVERQRVKRIEEIQGNNFYIGRLSRLATAK